MLLRSVLPARALTLLLCCWLSCSGIAAATPVAELRLIGAETEFFCYRDADEGKVAGFACELQQEIARRVGYQGPFDIYPLPRAIAVASVSAHMLIGPLGRIASREKLFAWQVEMFEEDFVLVTMRSSTLDISSDEAIKDLHIGTIRDGAGARMLSERGAGIVELVAGDAVNARKLHAGRIDAWAAPWNAILAAQKKAGLSPGLLRRGLVLGRVKVYLAGSLDLDPAVAAAWQAAFSSMRKDGTFELLARKYQYVAPPGEATSMSVYPLKTR